MGPPQIPRGERDFCFSDYTSRPRHGLVRAECPRCSAHEILRADEIAELCHSDTAKSERRPIIAQGDTFERTQGVACRECSCRSCNQ